MRVGFWKAAYSIFKELSAEALHSLVPVFPEPGVALAWLSPPSEGAAIWLLRVSLCASDELMLSPDMMTHKYKNEDFYMCVL
jgi:hypothetical protein